MARFRGTTQGQRGEASRLGSARSGLVANVNGWDAGVRVTALDEAGQDVFYVWATGGSNANSKQRLLGVLKGACWMPADGQD